jgi:hypothetical protein
MSEKHPFVTLLEKVDKIDISAGCYIRTKAREIGGFVESAALSCCFIWRHTPQGWDYWHNIAEQLGKD